MADASSGSQNRQWKPIFMARSLRKMHAKTNLLSQAVFKEPHVKIMIFFGGGGWFVKKNAWKNGIILWRVLLIIKIYIHERFS